MFGSRFETTMSIQCMLLLFLIVQTAFARYKPDKNVCTLPKKVGPCRAMFPRYYFDKQSGVCKPFNYGGCRGNGNNFLTVEKCRKVCGCKAPAKTGLCRAYFERYYYDQKTGRCDTFVYGGCGANENNFKDNRECMNTCT